ncbi:GNAT family N-acetyltransferase [Streptomyces sp. PTD5-9]|uniref:GNAT family N-acetyltransferase n=1 Tax=Streptomyces sp. PTD5-9 TaxID=3120150 RepID=UPI00300ADF64
MFRVREMNEADIDAVSAIRVRGWRHAYAGIVPRAHLNAMTASDDAEQRRAWFAHPRRRSTDLVAVDAADAPVGWICFGPYRGRPSAARWEEPAGEIYALYIRPELIGHGVGRALLVEAHARMGDPARGFRSVFLWVFEDNRRARRFYERFGYRADGETQDDVYDDITLTELRHHRALHRNNREGISRDENGRDENGRDENGRDEIGRDGNRRDGDGGVRPGVHPGGLEGARTRAAPHQGARPHASVSRPPGRPAR